MADNPFTQAVVKAEQDEKRAREHDITIYARGGHTSRECYCISTNGYDHHEDDSPWVVSMDGRLYHGGFEQPLETPFRNGEDLEEYNLRLAKRDAWNEASESVSDWMWNNPSPDGTPHDPPTNPYE